VGFEVADCDVAAASREAVFDLVKGISCDPLRASGFCSCGWVRGSLVSGEETVMVMPLAGRVVAAVAGGLLVILGAAAGAGDPGRESYAPVPGTQNRVIIAGAWRSAATRPPA